MKRGFDGKGRKRYPRVKAKVRREETGLDSVVRL